MTIELYKSMSPANYVRKNIQLVETLNGNLRKPTSVVDPTITIEREAPTGFNYARIPEFDRYYFVTGIASEINNLIAVSMHVDVLMTYGANIRAAKAIVRRNEFRWNLYLDDGSFKAYQNSKHKIRLFPNGFEDFSYILALAGNSQ